MKKERSAPSFSPVEAPPDVQARCRCMAVVARCSYQSLAAAVVGFGRRWGLGTQVDNLRSSESAGREAGRGTDSNPEVHQMEARKKKAVRLYERNVQTITVRSDRSKSPPGRSAAELWQHLKRLKRLVHANPNSAFWTVLQKSILAALRYVETDER